MRWLSITVMVYMLAALTWWMILLLNLNERIKTFAYAQTKDGAVIATAMKNYEKQKMMIIGEGLVFGVTLLVGMYFIYRAFRKEIETTKNQNNFLLSISHELKSPLTSINLCLDTIKKHDLPKETKTELTDTALSESKRLESLINSILLTSKLDYGYQYNVESFDLVALIHEVTNVYTTLPDALPIDVMSTHPSVFINADKFSIKTVIINLIENAMKYGLDKPVKIEVNEVGSKVTLKVIDNGIGLSLDEKKKVFNKFYRVGEEAVRKSKGTGLGLYIVKKIIADHNAQISISDNVPTGSIFTIVYNKNTEVK
jgi:K+-sensing histidine kinase KdpD